MNDLFGVSMDYSQEEPERIERTRKPIKCPSCGERPVATILYGIPAFNRELEQKLNEGRIVIGGCIATDDDPVWECSECGQQIHRGKAFLESFACP